MKQKCLVTFSLFIYSLGLLFGQASYFPLGHDIYHEVNKLSPDQRTNIHIAARPYSRKSVFNLFKQVLSDSLPVTDAHKIQYFLKDTIGHIPDTGGKGFLNHFYKNPFHFLEYRSDDFSIVLNPILNFRTGYETETRELIYQNTRGLELYGDLDDKLYFYSAFFENQSNFLNYIVPYIDTYKAIRGQGNYKDFSSNLFSDLDGYDYSNVQAYLGYKLSKHSILELGHGKHFYGNGIRSLLLSDSGQNYFYLKFKVEVWKMFYQSIFSELSTVSARYATGSDVLSKKYMASHFLGFKLSPELEIALFEAVVFSRADHFEFQYLNPVVFYRTIEHMIDSPDNVLLGFNISWSPAHSLSFYGQWILDEMKTSQLFSGEGWWGNKYGFQLGMKYFDALKINGLDLQLEYNLVRPFTYSHWSSDGSFPELSTASYSHYNQPLAHPLGANFTEIIFHLRYPFNEKINVELQLLNTITGRNDDINWGQDILPVNTSRPSDFNVRLHQGARSHIYAIDLNLSYRIYYNLHLELNSKYRKDSNDILGNTDTRYIGAGLRYNTANYRIDY